MDTDRLPFVIQARGHFAPDHLRVLFDPAPRATTPDLDALIALEWERQMEIARSSNKLLFNGELLRYLNHAVISDAGGESLELIVGPTCYRDFVGTNLYNHHRLGEFDWSMFANPVGTTATLVCSDGRICYGRRSSRVSYHANHVHTFGGALEAADRSASGTIDPFASLLRELKEELALSPDDLTDLQCVGLIRDREIHQPELLFEARAQWTAAELVQRWQNAESRDEHDELVTLPDIPDAIVPFIHSCGPIAPVAVGALMLHGRLAWGDEWFIREASKLT